MAQTPNQPAPTPEGGSKKRGLALGLVALFMLIAVAAFGFAVYLLTQGSSPDEVDHDAAVAAVQSSSSTQPESNNADTSADNDAANASPHDLTGTWSVDTSTGEWDYEQATGSFVGFRVGEELVGIGTTEAVGRTGNVNGTLDIAGQQLTAANFTVDMASITTNESRRDRRVLDALNVGEHPEATFVITQPVDFGDVVAGETQQLSATGDLTINGTTTSVEFPLTASLVENTIVVTGSLDITFSDYGIEVPRAPAVLSASDHGPIELQLLFTRA